MSPWRIFILTSKQRKSKIDCSSEKKESIIFRFLQKKNNIKYLNNKNEEKKTNITSNIKIMDIDYIFDNLPKKKIKRKSYR